MPMPNGPKFGPAVTASYIRDPSAFFLEMSSTYGQPFGCQTMGGPMVLSGRPEDVAEIFRADPGIFEAWQVGMLEPVLGSTSLILSSGEQHRKDRRLLLPPFHGKRMRNYASLIAGATASAISRFVPGQEFTAHSFAQAVSLDVILQAVFGLSDPLRRNQYAELFPKMLALGNAIPMFFPILRLPFVPSWARFTKIRNQVDTLIMSEIQERRATGERGEDILSMLLDARYDDGSGMDDSHIRNQLLTMLVAGHETTAIAMSWALYWMHRESRILERLLDEIRGCSTDDSESFTNMEYMDAVVSESLRIHPIIPDIPRQLNCDASLMGHKLKAGTGVGAVALLTHRDPSIYPEPNAFRPERFLERKFSPYEFYPFGGGARRCIGSAFATFEVKVVLATLVGSHRIELMEEGIIQPKRRHITMMPAGGIRMKYLGLRS
jgi:cytochrome P450 family 110